MGRAFRGERVRRFAGRDELHVLLAGYVRAGKGKPAAHHLARRYGVGVDGQRIGDAHALGSRQAGVATSVGGGQNFGQVLGIHTVAGTRLLTLHRQLPFAAQGVDAEEVGTRVAEVTLLAVEHHALQCPRLFPMTHLFVGHVGDVSADVVLHLGLGQAEIHRQPMAQVFFPRIRRTGSLAVAGRKGQHKQDKIKQVLHINGKWRIENGK